MFTNSSLSISMQMHRFMDYCECLWQKWISFCARQSFPTMCCDKYDFNSLEIGCVIIFAQLFYTYAFLFIFLFFICVQKAAAAASTMVSAATPMVAAVVLQIAFVYNSSSAWTYQHSLYFWWSFFYTPQWHILIFHRGCTGKNLINLFFPQFFFLLNGKIGIYWIKWCWEGSLRMDGYREKTLFILF